MNLAEKIVSIKRAVLQGGKRRFIKLFEDIQMRKDLSQSQKLIYCFFLSWDEDKRKSGLFMSSESMGARLNLSPGALKRALRALKEKGIILTSGKTTNRRIFLREDLDEDDIEALEEADNVVEEPQMDELLTEVKEMDQIIDENEKPALPKPIIVQDTGRVAKRILGSKGKLSRDDEFVFESMHGIRVKECSKAKSRKVFQRALELDDAQTIRKAWQAYLAREKYNQTEFKFYMPLDRWLEAQIEAGSFDVVVETEPDYRLGDFEQFWNAYDRGVHDNKEKSKHEWVQAYRLGELPEQSKILEAAKRYFKFLEDDKYKMTAQNFIKNRKWNDFERKTIEEPKPPPPAYRPPSCHQEPDHREEWGEGKKRAQAMMDGLIKTFEERKL